MSRVSSNCSRSSRRSLALLLASLFLLQVLPSCWAASAPRSVAQRGNLQLSKQSALSTAATETRGGGRRKSSGATIPSHVFNLVKAIVGVGVLSLPAGIAAYGNAPSAVYPALALIAIVGALSAYGFALIGKVCALTGASSYAGAWERSVGPKTAWIPAASATSKTSLACLAFSMVLADTFTGLLRASPGQRTSVLVTLTVTVLLPLCWQKNLAALAPFSLLGVLGMVYTGVAMTKRWLDGSYSMDASFNAAGGNLLSTTAEKFHPVFGDTGWKGVTSPRSLILVCMLSTAFMAHFNSPKFYNELRDNTLPRFYRVVSVSFGVSILLMGAITAVGYLTFGSSCSGLVLNNYSTTQDMWMSLSRVAVAVALVFSYPLAFQGCRDGWLDLLKVKNAHTNKVLNVATVALLAVLTLAAATLKDVSLVLALGGATLGNALTYVYPAMMYGAIMRKRNRKEPVGLSIAYVSAGLGIAMGLVGAKMALSS